MTPEKIRQRKRAGTEPGALRWVSRSKPAFVFAGIATVFITVFFAKMVKGVSTETRDRRVPDHGIGITSPLADCKPASGCTEFSGDHPALYVQMVSSRSFVIGLAAAKVDQPSIFNSLRLKNLATQTDLAIDTVGYSRVTVGFDRFNEPISELRIHALLSEPLSKGHRQMIDLQLDGVPALEFTYQTDFTSPSIQVHQVGYLPNTGKHAFAGNWLGTAGSMPVDDTEFFIIRTGSGERVFRGQLKKITELDTWSGNAVYKADFGDLQEEGEYILSIDGLGQSHPFRISR
jgi:hypothetical protein